MNIEILGDKTLVESVECVYDNYVYSMLFIEIKTGKGVTVVAEEAVLQPGNADNHYQSNHYRPLRVTKANATGTREAEIRLYPTGGSMSGEDGLVDEDHFLASSVSKNCHTFMTAPKRASGGPIKLRWSQEEGQTYPR